MAKINGAFIRDFCQKHDIEIEKEESWDDGYLLYLKECPFNSNHNNGDVKIIITKKDTVRFKCWHDSDKDKTIADFIKKFEPDFFKGKGKTVSSRSQSKSQDREPGPLDQFHIFSRGKPSSVYDFRIFEHLSENNNLFVMGGVPYMYKHGVYIGDPSGATLKTEIRKLIYPELIKSTTIERVYKLFLGADELRAKFQDLNSCPPHWINFRNGFYDPIAKKMIAHDPKYKAINQIPHEYDPEAQLSGDDVEKWLQFIVPEPDDREMLLQYMGYCLTRDTRQQKFLILCGEGGSGKSTLIKVIESMIGAESISNISLKELSQRFASYGLLGKLLNSCADLELSALEDTATIKKVLGEDSLRGEAKGRDAVSFKSYAKLLFSCNELPLVLSEKTNGFYRRLLILSINKKPEQERADFTEILLKQSDYMIHLAVEALIRMYQDGHITQSRGSLEAVQRLRCDSDTVEAWLQDECSRVKSSRVERVRLYQKYERYCVNTERASLSRNNFYRSMRLKGFREMKTGGFRYFEGISVEKTAPKTAPDFALVDEQTEIPFK